MESSIIAAIIAAAVAILTIISNTVLSIQRNKQDGITSYRMKWVESVRSEFTNILSWTWFCNSTDGKITINSIDDLRKSVYRISLLLNIKDEYDRKILSKTFEYLESASNVYFGLNFNQLIENDTLKTMNTFQNNELYNKSEKIKKDLLMLVRVYLKTEWTRVKCESSINKIRYIKYWRPFVGFQASKAINDFLLQYENPFEFKHKEVDTGEPVDLIEDESPLKDKNIRNEDTEKSNDSKGKNSYISQLWDGWKILLRPKKYADEKVGIVMAMSIFLFGIFKLMEWALYFTMGFCIFCLLSVSTHVTSFFEIGEKALAEIPIPIFVIFNILCFLFARIFRLASYEINQSQKSEYIINVFNTVIAVMALIVAIIVK